MPAKKKGASVRGEESFRSPWWPGPDPVVPLDTQEPPPLLTRTRRYIRGIVADGEPITINWTRE